MDRAALLLIVLGGCFAPTFDDPRCGPGGACPDGWSCVDGICRSGTVADGAAPDAPSDRCPDHPDLVACYRFADDAGAQPHDDSPFHNSGQSKNVDFAPGHAGTGLQFNQTSFCKVPESASLDVTETTLEAWVHLDALPPAGGDALVLDNNLQYGLIIKSDGKVRCVAGPMLDGLTVTVGTWTHLACTFDGNAMRLYQDGRLDASIENATPIPTAPMDGLAIGHESPNGGRNLEGVLDDVRIWRRARSAEEICADAGC